MHSSIEKKSILTKKTAVAVGIIILLLIVLIVSRIAFHSQSGGTPQQEQMAADVNAIASRSGGHWEKLTPADKAVMLKAADGNESGAKQLLFALSGRTYEGRWGKPGPRPAVHPLGANGVASP